MSNDVMIYQSSAGKEIELSPAIVKQYLVSGDASKVSDKEIVMFMNLCKFQGLNPWLKEAYIIKYGNSPATLVTGKETFLKRAKKNAKYEGHTVEITPDGKEATAKVYVKGYKVPITVTVELSEYIGLKSDGATNSNWKKRPKTMLKKVALVQALREAFPDDLGGIYEKDEQVTVTLEAEIVDEKTSKADTVKPAKKEQDQGAGTGQETAAVMASPKQLKAIHTICTKHKVTKHQRMKLINEIIKPAAKLKSSTELTLEQANIVVDALVLKYPDSQLNKSAAEGEDVPEAGDLAPNGQPWYDKEKCSPCMNLSLCKRLDSPDQIDKCKGLYDEG